MNKQKVKANKSKIGIVTKFEIVRQLKKPLFWIFLLILPLGIFAIVGISALDSYTMETQLKKGSTDLSTKNIGLTNESGMYANAKDALTTAFSSETTKVNVVDVNSVEDGKKEIAAGNLDIYYHLPNNFAETMGINVYYRAAASSLITDYGTPFMNALKANAINNLGLEDKIVVSGGMHFDQIALNNEGNAKNQLGEAIIPLAIAAIFYLLICVFGNRLVAALAEEKENRITEMILTSISSRDFVIGKIISLIVLGFIQIAVFIIPLLAMLVIYRDNPVVQMVTEQLTVNPLSLVVSLLLLFVSYFFFAGSATYVSSMVPTARDANNYFGIVIMGVMLPLFFMSSFLTDTPTITTYALSIFPLSAPVSLMARNALGTVTMPELILGIVELGVCSTVVIRLTTKSFQKNALNFSMTKPKFGIRKSWKK